MRRGNGVGQAGRQARVCLWSLFSLTNPELDFGDAPELGPSQLSSHLRAQLRKHRSDDEIEGFCLALADVRKIACPIRACTANKTYPSLLSARQCPPLVHRRSTRGTVSRQHGGDQHSGREE